MFALQISPFFFLWIITAALIPILKLSVMHSMLSKWVTGYQLPNRGELPLLIIFLIFVLPKRSSRTAWLHRAWTFKVNFKFPGTEKHHCPLLFLLALCHASPRGQETQSGSHLLQAYLCTLSCAALPSTRSSLQSQFTPLRVLPWLSAWDIWGCSGVAHGDPSWWQRLRDRPPQLCQQSLNPWEARARHSCRLLSSAIPARRGDIFKPAGWPVFHSSPWKWSVVPKLLKCSITRKTGTGHACSTNLHDHTSLSGHVLASSGVKKLFSCISCSISSPRSPVRQWKCSTIVLQKCMRFSKNYGFFPL